MYIISSIIHTIQNTFLVSVILYTTSFFGYNLSKILKQYWCLTSNENMSSATSSSTAELQDFYIHTGSKGIEFFKTIHYSPKTNIINMLNTPIIVFGVLIVFPTLLGIPDGFISIFQINMFLFYCFHYSSFDETIIPWMTLLYSLPMLYAIKISTEMSVFYRLLTGGTMISLGYWIYTHWGIDVIQSEMSNQYRMKRIVNNILYGVYCSADTLREYIDDFMMYKLFHPEIDGGFGGIIHGKYVEMEDEVVFQSEIIEEEKDMNETDSRTGSESGSETDTHIKTE